MSAFVKRKADAGFLLIELLAASLILSIALVVLSRSFSSSASLLQHTSFLLRAETLLEEKMMEFEQAKTLSAGSREGTFPIPGSFHWSTEIEKETESFLYEVAVTISWKEGWRPQSLTVTTLLAKPSETL